MTLTRTLFTLSLGSFLLAPSACGDEEGDDTGTSAGTATDTTTETSGTDSATSTSGASESSSGATTTTSATTTSATATTTTSGTGATTAGTTGGARGCTADRVWAEPGCTEPPGNDYVVSFSGDCYLECDSLGTRCPDGTCQKAWVEDFCPCPPWEQTCCDGCGGAEQLLCLP